MMMKIDFTNAKVRNSVGLCFLFSGYKVRITIYKYLIDI